MAHAQKFNRSNMGHMLRHYARQPGEIVKRNNECIDPDRTHLNYNLAAELQPNPQKDFINKAIENVKKAKETVEKKMTTDIIAIFIKDILENLGCITGEFVTEDIINEIFSKFCLGK